MKKGRPDSNLEKHLAELGNHPALLRRCQEFYLDRVINRLTYEELGKKHGVSLNTAYLYVKAYRKIASQYADTSEVQDVVAFCEHEIARLLQERAKATTPQDYTTLTREIRAYQGMLNEVTGMVDRRPQVNIQINEIVNIVVEEVPGAMRGYLGQALTESLITEILDNAGQRIALRVNNGDTRNTKN